MVNHFDYRKVAADAGISGADLARLEAYWKGEYPGDDLLAELHIYRSADSIRTGEATLDEILSAVAA